MGFINHYSEKCRDCPNYRSVGTMAFGRDKDDHKTWQTETSYYCNIHAKCEDTKCLLYGLTPRIDTLEGEAVVLNTEIGRLEKKVTRLEKELFDEKELNRDD
jgi:hypothetical protein